MAWGGGLELFGERFGTATGANEVDHLLSEGRWIGGTGSGHVALLSNTRSYMSTKPGQHQALKQ